MSSHWLHNATHRAPKQATSDKKDVKIDDKDVKLLREQTGCSEEKAIEALKANDGDLINASECSVGCGVQARKRRQTRTEC